MNPGPTGRMRGMAWLQIGLGGFLILSATGTHAPGWTISDPSARWRVENRGDHVILRSSDGRSWRRLSGSEIEASRSESALLPPPLESQAPVLVKVAELPASFGILTQDPPLDLDGDGNLELILTKGLSWSPTLWVYESVGNDSFALAHTITVPGKAGTVSINPTGSRIPVHKLR